MGEKGGEGRNGQSGGVTMVSAGELREAFVFCLSGVCVCVFLLLLFCFLCLFKAFVCAFLFIYFYHYIIV